MCVSVGVKMICQCYSIITLSFFYIYNGSRFLQRYEGDRGLRSSRLNQVNNHNKVLPDCGDELLKSVHGVKT